MGLKNAWLCGFTEADGSLGFQLAKDKTRVLGCRLRIYWYIDQCGLNAKTKFESMIKVLGFGYIEKKKKDISSFTPSNQCYRLITKSSKDCKQLQTYFNTYTPLTTIKKVRFIRWNRVLNWSLDRVWNQHFTEINRLINLNKKL